MTYTFIPIQFGSPSIKMEAVATTNWTLFCFYNNNCVGFCLAHINHIREIAGVDSVGVGAGYDGIN